MSAGGLLPDARLLREATMRRLLAMDQAGELETGHVLLAASSLGVTDRTDEDPDDEDLDPLD